MDYKELLKKYIKHVGYTEGVTFIGWDFHKIFTKEEWKELARLAEEVGKEDRNDA